MFKTGKTQADFDLEKEKNEAIKYLQETDWYVARTVDTGKEIPKEIIEKRIAAREIL